MPQIVWVIWNLCWVPKEVVFIKMTIDFITLGNHPNLALKDLKNICFFLEKMQNRIQKFFSSQNQSAMCEYRPDIGVGLGSLS